MEKEQVFVIEGSILKRYTGPGGDVVVPEGVTEIGANSFRGCTGLTSVTLPEGVTRLDGDAFWGCTGLTSVTLPEGVTEIGIRAFWGCTGLTRITIPEGVTEIGINAFRGCTGLTSVTIPEGVIYIPPDTFEGCTGLTHIHVDTGNQVYCSIDGLLLERDEDDLVLMRCPQGRTGAFTVPEGVTRIGRDAFKDCIGLTSVTIPASVTDMSWPFRGCTALTDILVDAGNPVLRMTDGTLLPGC